MILIIYWVPVLIKKKSPNFWLLTTCIKEAFFHVERKISRHHLYKSFTCKLYMLKCVFLEHCQKFVLLLHNCIHFMCFSVSEKNDLNRKVCIHCNATFHSGVSLSNHLRAYARRKRNALLEGTSESFTLFFAGSEIIITLITWFIGFSWFLKDV